MQARSKIDRAQGTAIALAAAFAFIAGSPEAFAEYSGFQETETLRTPLIPGAAWSPAYQCPPEGQPPPVGDGPVPAPVTPGHLGGPCPPPTAVPLPPMGPMDKPAINAMLAPYLTPPPSTAGEDPGLLPGVNGYIPPASVVQINPGGGIDGQAPTTRWGGQSTKDFGRPKNYGALTVDFGQDIDTLPAVTSQGIVRSVSEDGPRPAIVPGRMGATTNKQANLAGAHTTVDLHGNRILFKGANNRSRMTIAPY